MSEKNENEIDALEEDNSAKKNSDTSTIIQYLSFVLGKEE